MSFLKFDNARLLITGASSGIGRAVAQKAAEHGASLTLIGRNEERLKETLESLQGHSHQAVSFDLKETQLIDQLLKNIAEEKGSFSGLIHAAGIQKTNPLKFTKDDEFNEVLKTNLGSAFAIARGFRQKGVSTEFSAIVFVSSVMGIVGQPGQAAYSASKGALIAMSKSLALELAREKIRVNCIAPGIVETEMTKKLFSQLSMEQVENIRSMHPLGFGEPADVASAALFLVSEASKWITGSVLVVDGGYTAH